MLRRPRGESRDELTISTNLETVDAAMEFAERIAQNAPKGVRASKKLLKDVLGVSEDDFWAFQQPAMEEVFGSEDAIEGATAFAEKRAPNWQDK